SALARRAAPGVKPDHAPVISRGKVPVNAASSQPSTTGATRRTRRSRRGPGSRPTTWPTRCLVGTGAALSSGADDAVLPVLAGAEPDGSPSSSDEQPARSPAPSTRASRTAGVRGVWVTVGATKGILRL